MVIGSDQVIPMARLLDVTSVANEYDFHHEFIGDNLVGADASHAWVAVWSPVAGHLKSPTTRFMRGAVTCVSLQVVAVRVSP